MASSVALISRNNAQHRSAKREVGVDAKTGKVLEDSKEGSNPD